MRLVVLGADDFLDSARCGGAAVARGLDQSADLAVLPSDRHVHRSGATPQNELIAISCEEFPGPGFADIDRVPPDVSKLKKLGSQSQPDLEKTLRDAIEFNLDPKNHKPILGGVR